MHVSEVRFSQVGRKKIRQRRRPNALKHVVCVSTPYVGYNGNVTWITMAQRDNCRDEMREKASTDSVTRSGVTSGPEVAGNLVGE